MEDKLETTPRVGPLEAYHRRTWARGSEEFVPKLRLLSRLRKELDDVKDDLLEAKHELRMELAARLQENNTISLCQWQNAYGVSWDGH